MERSHKYRIKVLEKTFRILDLFLENNEGLTAKEISDLAGFNKSSAYRILRNLEDAAYLEKDPKTQRYRVGFGIYCLGAVAESYSHIRSVARPVLERLSARCDETVHLAVLQDGQALYIDKIESRNRVLRIISRVGAKLPGHCSGVGKMLLSSLELHELDRIIDEWGLPALTENTITDRDRLVSELEKIREEGYSVDREEIEKGLKCLAVPVRNGRGAMVAAVSISAPKERFEQEESNYRKLLDQASEEISGKLSSGKTM